MSHFDVTRTGDARTMTHARGWLMGLTLLALLLAGRPAVAAPGSPPQLVIVSAKADVAAGTLTIDGDSFGDSQPVVALNGMPLVVVSATPSEIVADLPPGLAPGTYLLTVSRGPARTQFDSFDVTLGAAGPPGPTGPTGATGPRGPAGTFTGHFQSPNGAYSLDVTDAGIRLAGPTATVQIVGGTVTIMATNVTIRSDADTTVRSGGNTTIGSAVNTDIRSSVNTTIMSSAGTNIQSSASTSIQSGGATDIKGAAISLNGPGRPAARVNDAVLVDPASGSGVIKTGSPTVSIGD